MNKFSATILILSLIIPATGFTQSIDACHQARQDAEADVNSSLWRNGACAAACLLSPVIGLGVVGLAYFLEPDVPSSNFLGKSSDYVEAYIDCYEDEARDIRTDEALGGCMAGTLITVGMLLVSGIVAIAMGNF